MSDAPIRTLVLLGDGVPEGAVQRALGESGAVTLTGIVEGLDEDWRPPAGPVLDVLVVACSDYSERALDLIDTVVGQRPQLPVVVFHVAGADSNGFMQSVFEAGADDIVTLPEEPDRVLAALRKAIARRHGSTAAAGVRLAPLIAVVGPKGGTGKTVTTCNLAGAFAEAGRTVAVVDLDLSFGDIALGLRLTPVRTIYDLARMGGSLDAEKVEGFLVTHSSGVRALLAPIRPDHAGGISADFLTRVFHILRGMHDYVVVDTPAGFSLEVISAIDNSSNVCIVGMLDAFSLKDTKLGLETLERMGYDSSRIRIVLNRADGNVGITYEDVTEILGRRPDVFVPSDILIPRSVNEGGPIVLSQSSSPASRAFHELAQLYLPAASRPRRDEPKPPPSRRRLLRRRS